MNVDYRTLEDKILDGTFRSELEDELTVGFRAMKMAGDPLPLASYYAAKIAEIVSGGAPVPLRPEVAYVVYQEILAACEHARATVMGEG